jgi:hypothetical protein
MSKMLQPVLLKEVSARSASVSSYSQDDRRGNILGEIDLVPGCIDLSSWRHVIDEILSEVEAANEKARLLETALQSFPPPISTASSASAIPRVRATTPHLPQLASQAIMTQ